MESELQRHDDKVNEVKGEVAHKAQENRELEQQVESLNGQAQFATMTATKVQELAKAKLFQLQTEIAQREEEIRRLNQQIGTHEHKLSTLHVANHFDVAELKAQAEQLAHKDKQIADLQRELEDTRRRLDEVVMTRKSEGTALLEIEHYKADNERLVQMLAATREFSAFGKLALDTAENTIRYLNPGQAALDKRLQKCHSRAPKATLTLKDFKGEEEEWVPEEAFRVAHDFRNRCASTVSQALMNQLLADLNKIWRDREKKSISRVQNNAHREI